MYSPSLTHVAYPAEHRQNGNVSYSLILRDVVNKKEVARIYTFYDYGSRGGIPWWSPDGTRILLSALPEFATHEEIVYEEFEPYEGGGDLYSISKKGEIVRLSTLAEKYVTRQKDYIWSPDGGKVAFLLRIEDGDDWSDWQLSVLDISTGIVTNYCIESELLPIWSPDSKKVLIHIPSPVKDYQHDVLLVDLENGFAVRIAEQAKASRWMEAP